MIRPYLAENPLVRRQGPETEGITSGNETQSSTMPDRQGGKRLAQNGAERHS